MWRSVAYEGGLSPYLGAFECTTTELITDLGDETTCNCVDERILRKKGDIHLIAAGALLRHTKSNGLTLLCEAVKRAHTTKFFSHDDCGGMRILYGHLHGQEVAAALSMQDLNAFSRRTVKDLAAEVSAIVGWPIEAMHHYDRKFHNSKEFHPSITVYVVGLRAGFNPNRRFIYAPLGYVVSKFFYDDPPLALEEAALCNQLILQTYGSRVTSATPLHMVALSKPEDQNELLDGLHGVASQFPGNIVRVEPCAYPFA